VETFTDSAFIGKPPTHICVCCIIIDEQKSKRQECAMVNEMTGGLVKHLELDEKVTLSEQIKENAAPVILINKFNVKAEEVDDFIRAWTIQAQIMKRQPGFISAQLHHGIGGSSVFLNYAIWESTEHFRKAVGNPELQSSPYKLPASTVASPHLFKKVAIPGICEGE
jgi:quinol monooxygenase YgiN